MSSITTPPPAPTPNRQQRHVTYTEWPTQANGPTANLQAAIDAATNDPDRGDRTIWYRTDLTSNGPVLVVGYTSETVA